ncbi:MAG: YesL family protein [Eubacterium sp.]
MFNIDGKFFGFISRLGDLVILNVLFWVCCIPVFTIGAATTAMYSVTKKMAENKESYIIRSFFQAFKENFKQSTIMWLILMVLALIPLIDFYIISFMEKGIAQTLFRGFMLLSLIVIIFVIIYALTLQCTFENTIKNTLKNALFISLGHAPWSIVITILTLSPYISLLYFGKYFGVELLAILLIWFSGVAYINSFILNRIYKKYMQ